jgi:hypothetical protein
MSRKRNTRSSGDTIWDLERPPKLQAATEKSMQQRLVRVDVARYDDEE